MPPARLLQLFNWVALREEFLVRVGRVWGDPIPTIVGDSAAVAGPGSITPSIELRGRPIISTRAILWAVEELPWLTTPPEASFDVLEAYDTRRIAVLTAYKYTDNEHIDQLWQIAGGILLAESGSVAIGADGKVYYCTPGR